MDEMRNTIKRIQYQYLALSDEQKSKIRGELSKKLSKVIDLLNSAEKDEKEGFTPTINEPLPPFYEEDTEDEDKRFSGDTKISNLYELWRLSSVKDKFKFVCPDKEGHVYYDWIDLEKFTDELKIITVNIWSLLNTNALEVSLDRKNYMKLARHKSISSNPICGTKIGVFTICEDDYVTFKDSSSNNIDDSFMVKWGYVPQNIRKEIQKCTNNMLSHSYDREEEKFYWSFALSKCEFNRVVDLLCDNAG